MKTLVKPLSGSQAFLLFHPNRTHAFCRLVFSADGFNRQTAVCAADCAFSSWFFSRFYFVSSLLPVEFIFYPVKPIFQSGFSFPGWISLTAFGLLRCWPQRSFSACLTLASAVFKRLELTALSRFCSPFSLNRPVICGWRFVRH